MITKTLLLVEDEAVLALTQEILLKKYGYNVIKAKSGENALIIFRENTAIDLILMDIDLGAGMNGPETAVAILQERMIPIVFVSSHTEPEVVEKTEQITSYGYVVKDTGITVLDASIKMALKLFDANRQIAEKEIIKNAMISNISDVICTIGEDGILKYISPNIQKLFGWIPEELVGTDGVEVVHKDDLVCVRKEFFSLLRKDNSTTEIEFRYKCKDGTYKLVELTIMNLANDPVVKGFLLNFHDITEKKQIELALLKSEDRYRTLVNNSKDMIYRMSLPEGKYEYVSPACFELTGCTPEEHYNGEAGVKIHIHPEYIDYFNQQWKDLMIGKVLPEFEYKIIDKNGNEKWLYQNNYLIRDEYEAVIAIEGKVSDITYRKRFEEKIKSTLQFVLSIFDALTSHICVLDMDGNIIGVNQAWRRFAEMNPPHDENHWVGVNYFNICENAFGDYSAEANSFLNEIKKIIHGEAEKFMMEYPCHSPEEKRWFILRVNRFKIGEIEHLLVVHENITELKRVD